MRLEEPTQITVVPYPCWNANKKSHPMPSDVGKKKLTPSTIQGGLHNASKPSTSFSTSTYVPNKKKLDLKKVEDDSSGA